jgi:hypothetical protein
MGNACSKEQQPDSVRVQEDNIGEPCMLPIHGAPNNWKIYYRVIKFDGKFTISIFVKKYKLQENLIIPVCFFKMKNEPSRIEFDLSENGSFSITAYISKETSGEETSGEETSGEETSGEETSGEETSGEETSGEIAVRSITWESNEYTVCKEDGFFLDCVKKIQRTDCEMFFVSELKPKSLSAQDVSPSNESQTDGSATLAPEVFSSDNDAGASGLRVNVQPPQTAGHSSVNSRPYKFEKDFREMLNKLEIYYNMLKSIQLNGGVKYPHLYFPECNFCIIRSAKNRRKVLKKNPDITLYDDSVSDSISPVIQMTVIDISIDFSVNGVDVSLILTVPKDVIRVIANLYRVNCPDILGTVSLLINQYVALLQLDYDPSKTSLVLSNAVCDNRHRFLLWICHQMRLIISRLERRASSENETAGFEIVECDNSIAPCVDASSAVKDVNRRQEFARCGPVEESTTGRNIKTVRRFSGRKYMFTVSDDSKLIVYKRLDWDSPCNTENDVQFGIIDISSLLVYELLDGVYLIIIQTKSGQTYLSGYLSTNATPIFATCQITSNLDDKRFKSFQHVSETVFTCFFSDGTEKTFSIESGSYATINEVLDA